MTLQHDCSRHGCYKDKLPDWAILDGCFPRGIRPSDVDGIVEMNEHILMLEWKPALSAWDAKVSPSVRSRVPALVLHAMGCIRGHLGCVRAAQALS